ncbi:sodium-independent sulfate anion transporter [Engraulis encrasicolus]|uniref:sodium-independent sulfate anion transporter n=1 Tax=Engraulis encrasicolus TaxID=184585 RepID=UPI002FD3840E
MTELLINGGFPEARNSAAQDWCKSCLSVRTLHRWIPILSWLPKYNFQWLLMDVLAGITVALTTVPQALAYAEVAGLPVQYGLYSAFMGCFIYCVLGTSKDVTLGPTAIMSLLCSYYIGGDPVYAVLLTFLCGVIQAAMALFRLGFLLELISYPVIKGFTSAAAVTIGFGQIKNILGLTNIPRQFFLEVFYTFQKIPETRLGDVLLGVCCLLLLNVFFWMKKTLPPLTEAQPTCVRMTHRLVWGAATVRNALVVVGATLMAFSLEVSGHHVFTLTGKTSTGLPPFTPPPFSEITPNGTVTTFQDMVLDLGGGLAIIPLMGLLESLAIAKAFGNENNYRIDPNQELFAIGITNIMGSFVSAYPVTGSFGRTAVNSQTGVCTPAGGIITGVLVLLSLAYVMPVFHYIPKASLAAVIICAVAPLFDYKHAIQLWKVKKVDLLAFLLTFLLCLWEIQYGIVGGALLSGAVLLYHQARPRIKVSDHGPLVMELDSGLSFPAAEYLSDTIYSHALRVSPPRSVVLDCHHVSRIDFTVVNELGVLLRQFKLQNVRLVFSGLKSGLLEVLNAADLPGLQYEDNVEAALQSLLDTHDD